MLVSSPRAHFARAFDLPDGHQYFRVPMERQVGRRATSTPTTHHYRNLSYDSSWVQQHAIMSVVGIDFVRPAGAAYAGTSYRLYWCCETRSRVT